MSQSYVQKKERERKRERERERERERDSHTLRERRELECSGVEWRAEQRRGKKRGEQYQEAFGKELRKERADT